MRDADHRRFGDGRVTDGSVFQINRGNPLATRLDNVLGAVGDLHVAVSVDRCDVTGIEPALAIKNLPSLAAVILAGDPRSLDQ
ncbi:hypothetical protein D9M71_217630 [compost metagenome]